MSVKDSFKKAFEQDPVVATGVGAAVIIAIAKLMDANTNRKNSKSWKRETIRRDRKSKGK